MPWLAHHQTALYWSAIAAALFAGSTFSGSTFSGSTFSPSPWREWKTDKRSKVLMGLLFAAGVYVTLLPFLPGLQSDNAAYYWSLTALLPLIGLSMWQVSSTAAERGADAEPENDASPFGFSAGLLVALVVSMIYTIGARAASLQRHSHPAISLAGRRSRVLESGLSLRPRHRRALDDQSDLSARRQDLQAASCASRTGRNGDRDRPVVCADAFSGQRHELRRMERLPLCDCLRAHAHALGILDRQAIPGAQPRQTPASPRRRGKAELTFGQGDRHLDQHGDGHSARARIALADRRRGLEWFRRKHRCSASSGSQ